MRQIDPNPFSPVNPPGPAPLPLTSRHNAPAGWIVLQHEDGALCAVLPGTQALDQLRAERNAEGRAVWRQVL